MDLGRPRATLTAFQAALTGVIHQRTDAQELPRARVVVVPY